MERHVVFALPIKNRPNNRGERGEDQFAKRQRPVKSFVAAAAAHINQRQFGVKNVSRQPKDRLTNEDSHALRNKESHDGN